MIFFYLPDILGAPATPFKIFESVGFFSCVDGAVAGAGGCNGGCPAVLGSRITPE